MAELSRARRGFGSRYPHFPGRLPVCPRSHYPGPYITSRLRCINIQGFALIPTLCGRVDSPALLTRGSSVCWSLRYPGKGSLGPQERGGEAQIWLTIGSGRNTCLQRMKHISTSPSHLRSAGQRLRKCRKTMCIQPQHNRRVVQSCRWYAASNFKHYTIGDHSCSVIQ